MLNVVAKIHVVFTWYITREIFGKFGGITNKWNAAEIHRETFVGKNIYKKYEMTF